MNTTKPVRRPGIIAKDIGGETLLYGAEEEVIHVLNPAARLVWELCDGQHTVKDVARAMRAGFSVDDEHDVIGDVQQTLQVFAAKGLLAH